MSYAELLRQMQHAILSNDNTAGDRLFVGHGERSGAAQLATYRRHSRYALLQTLRSHFPATRRVLGPAFDDLAKRCIATVPSRQTSIDRYAMIFADWAAAHLSGWQAELLLLEAVRSDIWLAPESEPLNPADLQPDRFATMVLHPRAAQRLLRFHYPVDAIRLAALATGRVEPPAAEPITLLLMRHDGELRERRAEPQEFALLEQLFAGLSVDAALATLPDDTLASTVQGWFNHWMQEGRFRRL